MPKIRSLSSEVIKKIAAGQVVERPASVVKELIENSLDAGAGVIEIDIRDAGLSMISVTDDGEGMEKGDVEKCFLPHATSKISTQEDLLGVKTFGFRGEALASVAAVARLCVSSRQRNSDSNNLGGWQVILEKSEVDKSGPVAAPMGTRVKVEDIFVDIPARKRFLKKPATEWRHITEVVTTYALAHPEVGFKLVHNRKISLHVPSGDDLGRRVVSILGLDIADGLVAINSSLPTRQLEITGFVGKPQLAGKSSRRRFLFVNGRPVVQPKLERAIKQAYGSLLDPKTTPIFVVFLKLPSEMVEVNINPHKSEVAFQPGVDVAGQLYNSVRRSLKERDLTYLTKKAKKDPRVILRDKGQDHYLAERLKTEDQPWSLKKAAQKEEVDILQVDNLYLVVSTGKGVLLIDQHAAHERVLYEHFLEKFTNEKSKLKVTVLKPVISLKLAVSDKALLEENLDVLSKFGFRLEKEEDQFTLYSIPELLSHRKPAELVRDVLDDLESTVLSNSKNETNLDPLTQRTLAFLACRSAIKAGEKLTLQERRSLVKKLAKLDGAYTCPHGRPVMVEVTEGELGGMFGR